MTKIASWLAGLWLAGLFAMPAHAQTGQLGAGQVWGNSSAAQTVAAPTSLSPLLDRALGSTRGAILERGASGWVLVAPSVTAGVPWVGNGAGADPAYQVLGIVGGGTNCAAASAVCLDNITGFASTGLLNRTGAGAYGFVGLPLSVSNGGTGGGTASGTLLDNITAFSSTGYMQRTGAGAYSFSSTIPATAIPFTQNGTGATAITLDALYRGKIVTPEMFGAVASPINTAIGSVADSTSAINAAITYVCSLGGGLIQFGPGVYKITSVATINCSNVEVAGVGTPASIIAFNPSIAGTGLLFSNGASILYNCGLRDISIQSPETTLLKRAIDLHDVSQFKLRNVNVAHYPVDGTLWRGGGSSSGLYIEGRELSSIVRFEAYAEMPLYILPNPNSTATEALDSWTFTDLTLANLGAANTALSVITIDPGVALSNDVFNGHQNWIGGGHGLTWSGTSGSASFGLYISGVKPEQPNNAVGYYIAQITPNSSSSLYNLDIKNVQGGDRNGINLAYVNNVHLDSWVYTPGASNNLGINATSANGVKMLQLSNDYWNSNTTATLTGLTNQFTITGPAGTSSAIPPIAFYK